MKETCCICNENPCIGHIAQFSGSLGERIELQALTKEEVTAAVAQAWCHPLNEHKEMDGDLAIVIVDNILAAQKLRSP